MLKQMYFLWALLAAFAIEYLSFVNAQIPDQSGFISLDCGLPRNSNYTETSTKINYISDADFISTGTVHSIAEEFKHGKQEHVKTLRSFPEGTRNCYRINVTAKTRYLIVGSFTYGNYDGLNSAPEFDIHLGANYWDTVSFYNDTVPTTMEIIHVTSENNVSVCLVNTGYGTPFITTLEFRPMLEPVYYNNTGLSLNIVYRWDTAGSIDFIYRYPYDIVDRAWLPVTDDRWASKSTTQALDANSTIPYHAPGGVMRTMASPLDENEPMEIYWDAPDKLKTYFFYLHFAELQQLKANESRALHVSVNNSEGLYTFVPRYLKSNIVFNTLGHTGMLNYTLSLYKTKNSTLPPILNAFELYSGLDLSQAETVKDDVDAINKIKSYYIVNKRNWDGDPCVPKDYLWTGLNCSLGRVDPPRIISLNLSSSGLFGEICTDISKLSAIEILDLSNNNLTGQVPDFLSLLPNLRLLNLERNNLSGSVPTELTGRTNKGAISLSVGGNTHLCPSPECIENKNETKKNKVLVPILASVGGVVVLLLIVIGLTMKYRLERKPQNETFGSNKREYTYAEVQKITNNFEKVLGKGAFGEVYHGFVDEHTQVAVKVLSSLSKQGYPEFEAEVKLLMKLYHGNLTNLVGYCYEEPHMVLIYEFMENGDLESHLSGDNSKSILSWERRLHIAIDAAQGLEYLHNGCKPPIVHRDIKPANILLNNKFRAKLADFGTSKSYAAESDNHVSTKHIAGTPGYLDPMYKETGWLDEKSDVYSFGVLLLELTSNRRPYLVSKQDQTEKIHLSQLISSIISSGPVITDVVDPGLQGDFDTNSAWKAVEIGLVCVSQKPGKRPNMTVVVSELKESLELELARKKRGRGPESTSTPDFDEVLMSDDCSEFRPLAR